MKRICVFSGASSGNKTIYKNVAQELGSLLAHNNIGLVYGGASIGLMGAVADATLEAGGHVIGVIPHALVGREIAHSNLPDLRVVDSMHERKAMMAELSDAFIALPGGIGTFEELFEVWTWTQLGAHAKPCALLNVDGFYDKLLDFIDHVVDQGVDYACRTLICHKKGACLAPFSYSAHQSQDAIRLPPPRQHGTMHGPAVRRIACLTRK